MEGIKSNGEESEDLRITTSVPQEFVAAFLQDCDEESRSYSAMAMRILVLYYRQKLRENMVRKLRADGANEPLDEQRPIPVYAPKHSQPEADQGRGQPGGAKEK